MKDMPFVSIIIAVKKINRYIHESMKHLEKLDYPAFEVLIFPDQDTGERFPNARIIPSGPMGPAEKRDLALIHAGGEILAFLDDDSYPKPDGLKRAVRHFHCSDVAGVGGPQITPPDEPLKQRAAGLILSSYLGAGSLRYRCRPTVLKEIDDCSTVNFLVRKELFRQVNGFDNHFWPGEDTKLALDLTKKLGKKIIYDPDAIVWHHRRPLFRPYLIQTKNYALHRGYFVKKFPETSRKLSFFLPSLFVLLVLFGWIAGLHNRGLMIAYLSILTVYIGAALATSLSKPRPRLSALVFLGILATHFVYGIWFIKGICSRRLAEERH